MCICYALRSVLDLCIIYIYEEEEEAGEGCLFNSMKSLKNYQLSQNILLSTFDELDRRRFSRASIVILDLFVRAKLEEKVVYDY